MAQPSTINIAQRVQAALLAREWSVRRCAQEFNNAFAQEIINGGVEKLDKDFVQRVRMNKFRVVSERVVKLCAFLNIPTANSVAYPPLSFCQKEILTLDRISRENPHLKKGIKRLLQSVLDVVGQGESNEIY